MTACTTSAQGVVPDRCPSRHSRRRQPSARERLHWCGERVDRANSTGPHAFSERLAHDCHRCGSYPIPVVEGPALQNSHAKYVEIPRRHVSNVREQIVGEVRWTVFDLQAGLHARERPPGRLRGPRTRDARELLHAIEDALDEEGSSFRRGVADGWGKSHREDAVRHESRIVSERGGADSMKRRQPPR